VDTIPTKRITVHIAINENGDYCLSEVDAQAALNDLVGSHGGSAFRVVDIDIDVLHAAPKESRARRAAALNLRAVD